MYIAIVYTFLSVLESHGNALHYKDDSGAIKNALYFFVEKRVSVCFYNGDDVAYLGQLLLALSSAKMNLTKYVMKILKRLMCFSNLIYCFVIPPINNRLTSTNVRVSPD